MFKSRINVILVGIAVAYIVLFFTQLFSPNLLTIRLYLTVAEVSLLISITELIKAVSSYFNQNMKNLEFLLLEYSELINQRCNDSVFITENNEMLKQKIQKEIDEHTVKSRKSKILTRIININVFLGYVVAIVMLITTPFKNITDGLEAQKIISLLSLVTFALMFISVALNEYFNDQQTEFKEKHKYAMEIERLKNEVNKLNNTGVHSITPLDKDGD